MHSVSLYHMRAFNKHKKYDDGSNYAPLDDVNGKDIVDIFKAFADELTKDDFEVSEEDKTVISFQQPNVSAGGRCIWGVINTGEFGNKGNIQDYRTGKLSYAKKPNDADVKEIFYLLFSPEKKNEAIFVLHNISGNGIKTILDKKFGNRFKAQTKLNLQFNPVAYEKAVEQWLQGQVKEIRAINFTPFSDKTDALPGMGHKQAILVLKPERNRSFGKFLNFRKGERSEAIEFLETNCKDLKAVVAIDGKERVFRIGGNRQNPVFRLDLGEEVTVEHGVPDFNEMYEWAVGVVNDICAKVYPGMGVKLCLEK
ncbi:hypothetical protein [Vreelandella aquamarina]|uniref:Uncharacterized protein n=1 Tax=Vreelandella aquamarina TaxID=77097 RepID=A0A857GIN6_9GAMM|nr:hypothetical protein [Halomonas meridiana]QHD49139.1 hypothetical protein CTT34_05235 [Halomonas meridiana]